MGFVDKLRMNNLYPTNGLTPPAMNDLDINALSDKFIPFIQNEHALNRQHEMDMAQLQNKNRLSQIGQNIQQPPLTNAPKNVVFNPGISDFQRATLGLKQQDLDTKRDLGQGKLNIADEGLDVKRQGIDATTKLAEKKLSVSTDQGQQGLDIKKSAQGLAEWKAQNPEGKIYAPKGGNVVVIDPRTGEAHDTGISSGTLTDEDKIKFTGQQNRETKQVIPGRAPVNSNADLPTQQKVGTQLTAQKLMNTHPEWAKFIKIDPNSGLVMVTPPSDGKSSFGFLGSNGPDKPVYDQINQALYPAKSTMTTTETKPTETKSTSLMEKTQRNPSTGATRVVVSSDGGKTWTPKQ